MRTATTDELTRRLETLPSGSRVVVSGNMAVPWEAVKALDAAQKNYVLHALNAPAGLPERDGVTVETCFVGPGMRRHRGLRYVPSRLSLVPLLYSRALPPDAVLLHCSAPRDGQVSLGLEVNVLPAAIEACRARGGLVVAVVYPLMPFSFGDAQVP
ncbi:MAG: acetyl-CoA hydrolase, partial [Terrabacter sp.]|nr:acetyl-CoA hydrolase [Terrabacter sp.]